MDVRQGSAKTLDVGSIPTAASNRDRLLKARFGPAARGSQESSDGRLPIIRPSMTGRPASCLRLTRAHPFALTARPDLCEGSIGSWLGLREVLAGDVGYSFDGCAVCGEAGRDCRVECAENAHVNDAGCE
jgi:hypothetical protein